LLVSRLLDDCTYYFVSLTTSPTPSSKQRSWKSLYRETSGRGYHETAHLEGVSRESRFYAIPLDVFTFVLFSYQSRYRYIHNGELHEFNVQSGNGM